MSGQATIIPLLYRTEDRSPSPIGPHGRRRKLEILTGNGPGGTPHSTVACVERSSRLSRPTGITANFVPLRTGIWRAFTVS